MQPIITAFLSTKNFSQALLIILLTFCVLSLPIIVGVFISEGVFWELIVITVSFFMFYLSGIALFSYTTNVQKAKDSNNIIYLEKATEQQAKFCKYFSVFMVLITIFWIIKVIRWVFFQ